MSNFWPIISAVLYALSMCVALFASVTIILRKQDPVKTLAWVSVMILLPYAGILLYLIFGKNYRGMNVYFRKRSGDLRLRRALSEEESNGLRQYPELIPPDIEPFKKLIYQNLKNSYSLLDKNTSAEFYFTGREALDAMYAAIEGAEHHVHLQTYILESDIIGERFTRLLIEKARSGVEVRLLYDGMGGIHLKKAFIRRLKENKIEVLEFSPVRFSFRVNYRNHRKILVVDGKVGFLGGVNIADRYYFGVDNGEWIDTQVRITGESVFSLQTSFLLDRYFVLNKRLTLSKKYFPHIRLGKEHPAQKGEKFYAQIISSGPDSDWAAIMQCYFTAVTSAKNHIYIISPYFTPNETILNAIKIAAIGNIDVRIMLPERSDSLVSNYCTRSYIGELINAGVKVYLFKEGFNHSKVLSIDGAMCIVGSANMDIRSFEHNFEIMSVLYSSNYAREVEGRFLEGLKGCELVSARRWKKRSVGEKMKESLFRLLSPLM